MAAVRGGARHLCHLPHRPHAGVRPCRHRRRLFVLGVWLHEPPRLPPVRGARALVHVGALLLPGSWLRDTHTSPARLLDHFRAGHDWPVTYGKPCDLGGMHALVGKDDRRVFLASASPLGPSTAIAVSLVCLRTRGDVAPGVPQFRCRLWSFL
jgi:hypothetical protein